jgi:hypothetical protein
MNPLHNPPERSWEEICAGIQSELDRRSRPGIGRRARKDGRAGAVPLGYRQRKVGRKTRVEIDPVLGPLVAELFRRAAENPSGPTAPPPAGPGSQRVRASLMKPGKENNEP